MTLETKEEEATAPADEQPDVQELRRALRARVNEGHAVALTHTPSEGEPRTVPLPWGAIDALSDPELLATLTSGDLPLCWTRAEQLNFAADCAERVLHIVQAQHPKSRVLSEIIHVARTGYDEKGSVTRKRQREIKKLFTKTIDAGVPALEALRAVEGVARAPHFAQRAVYREKGGEAEKLEKAWQEERLWGYLLGELSE